MIKNIKEGEEYDTYLTSQERSEPSEKIKYKELSANTVAFISCTHRLAKVLACATRGKRGSKGGGGPSEVIGC